MRALVFDLDDTLYLERDFVRSGFATVGAWALEHLNLQGLEQVAWKLFLHGQRSDILARAMDLVGGSCDVKEIDKLVTVYRNHIPDIRLQPDAELCLRLAREKWGVFILTDGIETTQRRKVEALGLRPMVDGIVYTDQLGRNYWKPHPKGFELIQQMADARPRECVYVGDNPHKDFVSPLVMGWRTVRVRRRGGLHYDYDQDTLAGQGAGLEITDLSGLLESLDQESSAPAGNTDGTPQLR